MDQPDQAPKVLIVDDSSIVLQVLGRQLLQAGYQVVASKKAVGVLRMVLAERPDLLILDITMPGLQVRTLCRMLKGACGQGASVVLHSGLEEAELADAAVRYGAQGYIHKGWVLERKLGVLRACKSSWQGHGAGQIELLADERGGDNIETG